MKKEIYEVGEIPPLGYVPSKMYAWTLRSDRLGEPINAYKREIVDIPNPKSNELIIFNMASGINYNGVWAAIGKPKDIINTHHQFEDPQDFLICGSESSGIVYAVGDEVKDFNVGDEVICIGVQYDKNCKVYKKANDPRTSPSFRIWGYEGNWGAFAQFSKVLDVQCTKKPKALSWEKAASITSTGATAYNMLNHWKGNEIQKDDVVLIWGGAGGLGSMAIQIVKALGGIPIAVVSTEERGKYCIGLGAKGYINRTKYEHWGILGEELGENQVLYKKWLKSVLKFRREIWNIVGERKNPQIVIEHPGADTLPTSIFVCDNKGMVVLCGATTGYIGSLDLRYLWLNLKRLQGSHAATIEDVESLLDLIMDGCVNIPKINTYQFEDIPKIHQDIYTNSAADGNMVVVIGAKNFK
ncbi:crotonyl-CoA carboxylase/reductase [Clostridium saccharoperbutylacetonicum]|uniref:crotonyl-CoA carboxylase/reductase n=1 Tax=Clostridium saccharoperbutylacetonicum TaxID=36745 RepID=UPI0039EA2C89